MSREWLDDDALRETLRRGDPAADGRDPAPEEIESWRRAMLREASRASVPRRFTLPLGVQGLAAAAAVTLAAALLWTAWKTGFRRVEAPPARITEAQVEASVPQATPPAPSVAQEAAQAPAAGSALPARPVEEEALPLVAGQPASSEGATMAGGSGATPGRAVESPVAVPVVARRTLQFTTPGGTRVFWTLERAPAAGI
jgi:hypothetical protein